MPALTAWALQHNPQTAAAWASLRAAAAALGVAKGAWLPTSSVIVNDQRSGTTYDIGISPPPVNGVYNSLTLSETLFHFGYRRATVDQARANVLASRFDANAALQSIALNVAVDYYDMAQAREEVHIYRQGVAEAHEIYADAEAQYRVHLKSATDVYQAQMELAQAQEQLHSAQGQAAAQRGILAEAAGLPVTTPLSVYPLPVPRDTVPASIHALLRTTLRKNPTLLAEQARVRAASAAVRQAASADSPSLSLNAGLGKNVLSNQPDESSFSIGLKLNIPLDLSYSAAYQMQQNRALMQEAQAQVRVTANAVQLSVWENYARWRGAVRAYKAARQQVASARKAVDGIRTEYRIGLASMLDLVTAEQNLISARIVLVEVMNEVAVDRAQLYRNVGFNPIPSR
ncbi:TolC family protein [Acidihalobacter aeolianus]|uniref:TolC family protein n=1 Tax=Acidihalobacter aeolianus TaxID=2792603 RepID=UPI0018D4C32F|nr:TolC family protein [Acidihalobacter aeolianus]